MQLKTWKNMKLKRIYVQNCAGDDCETLRNGEILIQNDERKLHSGSPWIQLSSGHSSRNERSFKHHWFKECALGLGAGSVPHNGKKISHWASQTARNRCTKSHPTRRVLSKNTWCLYVPLGVVNTKKTYFWLSQLVSFICGVHKLQLEIRLRSQARGGSVGVR